MLFRSCENGSVVKDADMALTPLTHTWPGNTTGLGVFDAIYKDANGKIYFIEAKGGNSPPGSRKLKFVEGKIGQRAQQGTKEYMDDIIANMRNKVDNLEDEISKLPQGQERDNLLN